MKMMRKSAAFLLVLMFVLALAGCGATTDVTTAQTTAEQTQTTEKTTTTEAPTETTATQPSTTEKETTTEVTTTQPADTETTDSQPDTPKSLKVLSIGNSLSRDGMHYLPRIAKKMGVDDIVAAYLYIGNCSLKTHLKNAKSGENAYEYYENRGDGWQCRENTSMQYALKAENWDYITLQQASGQSGVASSYKPLDELVDIVLSQAKGEPVLLWHMTWAYGGDCDYKGFAKYDYDQNTMYSKMTDCIKSEVLTNGHIQGVIPVGTAVQNARNTHLGDNFTRDGRHMSRPLGRYLAALTWYAYLTDTDVENIDFNPDREKLNSKTVKAVKTAVKSAVSEPLKVSND